MSSSESHVASADSPLGRAVVASGAGRYADPWHPFDATSALIGDVLRADGWHVDIIADPDAALSQLEGADLLVVNAGDPWTGENAARGADPAARAGLDAALDRGIGVLAVHSALSSLRDYPRWRATVGGSWEDDVSWHPPIGTFDVRIVDAPHPLTAGIDDFALFDERYGGLILDDGLTVLSGHHLDDVTHPLLWVRESPVRTVVSALGHDERSYGSPEHRELLRRAARWAAGG
jgi:type 1 glutamine amidotransferase